MNAAVQARSLEADELRLVLVLTRAPTLADAALRLGVDASTVFRSLHKVEKRLGRRLFERDRRGYRAGELALQLAAHAERIECELEAAAAHLSSADDGVSGLVRVTTTDALLYGLMMPVLDELMARHPALRFDIDTGYGFANLARRDADMALRATRRPPEHLIGRQLGVVRAAVFGHRRLAGRVSKLQDLADLPWAVADESLPDHPATLWRLEHLPKVAPRLQLHSTVATMHAIVAGVAIGVLPQFLVDAHPDVVALTDPLPECERELWLLTHPESRHLRHIAVVAASLAERLRLD